MIIKLFTYKEMSTYADKSTYFTTGMTREKVKNRGGYQVTTEEVACHPQDATHIEVLGRSKSLRNEWYDHPFVYALQDEPELAEWVLKAPFYQLNGKGFYYLYDSDLVGMYDLPPLLMRIVKGYAVKTRLDYDHWQSVGSTYMIDRLPFLEWAESMPVHPLIAKAD